MNQSSPGDAPSPQREEALCSLSLFVHSWFASELFRLKGSIIMKLFRFTAPKGALLSVCVLVVAAGSLHGTPPGDPICSAPNSLEFVQAIRDQMAAAANATRKPVRLLQAATRPQLRIEWPHELTLPRLMLSGTPAQTYHLEATSDLTSAQWTPWLSVVLDDQTLSWTDQLMLHNSLRFFRLRAEEPATLADSVSNFRLLDHTGTARDLYYHTHLDAIAVLAAGTDLDRVAPLAPLLDDLAKTYTNRMQIWILLSDPAPIRSNVVTRTKELKINFPVLFDQHGLAARSVGLTRAGEVALVQPPAFTASYRGEVAASGQLTASESFLGQALASLTASRPLTFLRTPVNGPQLVN